MKIKLKGCQTKQDKIMKPSALHSNKISALPIAMLLLWAVQVTSPPRANGDSCNEHAYATGCAKPLDPPACGDPGDSTCPNCPPGGGPPGGGPPGGGPPGGGPLGPQGGPPGPHPPGQWKLLSFSPTCSSCP